MTKKVVIAGASGFVGRALARALQEKGYEPIALWRESGGPPGSILWHPEKGEIEAAALEGVYAVVNLAGENIAARRWTCSYKERILRSRLDATETLVRAVMGLKVAPSVFISASAVGFYGTEGTYSETSPPGDDFLADVCQQWEAAAQPLSARGVRVVFARFGMVLGKEGGALATLLTPFKLGLGGVLGSGQQYISWVSLADAVGALLFLLETSSIEGPVNVVAPAAVTNYTFTKSLGKQLHRPTFLKVPGWLLRLLVGEMATPLLLGSSRTIPSILIENGYRFLHPTINEAFVEIFQRSETQPAP